MKTEDLYNKKRTENTIFAQDTLRQWNKVQNLRPVLSKKYDENKSMKKSFVSASKAQIEDHSMASQKTAGSYMNHTKSSKGKISFK